ncbi:MAG: DUF1611 domain-containing protein [Euryarchaeota archaeon]|nr:DUF1611 domain-containing protein [Euryarchaeota archaeon]
MRILILAHEKFTGMGGKTARGVYFYSPNEIVGILDRSLAGHYADEFFPGRRHVPIYENIESVAEDYDALIIGVAPIGGKLPEAWRKEIAQALSSGKTVISGLHDFLSEDPEFRKIAEQSGAKIWDVRKPPENLRVADGSGRGVNTVLVAGTDCSVGKMLTAVELTRKARETGINAGFVATGQTGMMIGADAGYVIDRIPGDFMAGAMEELVKKVSATRELIFVEGQGALTHPAYSGVTLSILHGSYPRKIILAHEPVRKEHHDYPGFPIPRLERAIEMYETLAESVSGGRVVGIAIDGEHMSDEQVEKYVEWVESELSMPAADVFRHGAEKLLRAVLK